MQKEFEYIVGFDFGHGETSAALVDVARIRPHDGVIPVEDIYICEHSREQKITSLVGYTSNGGTEVDIDVYDFKMFDHIEAYFKGPLLGEGCFEAISEVQKKHFGDFIKTVYKKLVNNPKNAILLGKKVRVYVGCPSGWSSRQIESYKNFLTNDCEVPVEAVVQESRAAHVSARKKIHERNSLLANNAKKIAVLDFGSSTLDITLHADKTYTDGYPIGAGQIEEELLRYFESANPSFKEKLTEYVNLYPTGRDEIMLLLRYAKEDYFNTQKKYPDKDIVLSCAIDWEDLSGDRVEGVSKLKISRDRLMSLIQEGRSDEPVSYEEKLRKHLIGFISKYGKADAVVLTGGASQMFFYKKIILECFGINESACVVDEKPSYSISQGVAMIGYMDSVCPLSGNDNNDADLPKEISELMGNIKPMFTRAILDSYKAEYTNTFCKLIDSWAGASGIKTLNGLILSLDNLRSDWDSRAESISDSINREVGKTMSESINTTLSEIIRLYFGFNAKIGTFDLDYSLCFSLPEDSVKSLFSKIISIIKGYVNQARFSVWTERSGIKDRSGDTKMMTELPEMLKRYATKWFADLEIGDVINNEVEDCKIRLKEYYFSTIRKITCQI